MIVAVLEQGPWDGLKIEFPDADCMPAIISLGMVGDLAFSVHEYCWVGDTDEDTEGELWKGDPAARDIYFYQGESERSPYERIE